MATILEFLKGLFIFDEMFHRGGGIQPQFGNRDLVGCGYMLKLYFQFIEFAVFHRVRAGHAVLPLANRFMKF